MSQDAAIARALEAAMPGVVAAYRSGSTARGDAGPDSDVDIAVLGTNPLAGETKLDLMAALPCVPP